MPILNGTMAESMKRNAERRAMLIAWLNNNPGFHSAKVIATAVGLTPTQVTYLAGRMSTQGLISTKLDNNYNKAYSADKAAKTKKTRESSSITLRNQAILDVLIKGEISNKEKALSAMNIVNSAYRTNPSVFKSEPNIHTAAGMMTHIYRESSNLHRVWDENSFIYWYDEQLETPRNIQVRVSKKSAKKTRTNGLGSAKTERPHLFLKTAIKPPPKLVNAHYLIVRTPDGKMAGVLMDNTLFPTLEEFVNALNKQ